ncbi:Ig-like domain-containing protein, partial [Xanthomonas citri pv. citri]
MPAPGSVVVTLPNAPAGITIDGNGVISVGAGAVRGAVTVTYQVCEAAAPGNCDSATVSLLLAPAPQPDVITVAAGATSSGNVGSNDDVPPGARFSVVGTPPPGLQFNPDGSYLYIPPAGTTGQIGFTYSVCLPAPDAAVCA